MKSIASFLKASLQEHDLEWPNLLPYLQMSYNVTVQRGMRFSPFEVLYGLRPRLSWLAPEVLSRPYYGSDYPNVIANRLRYVRDMALKNRMEFQTNYRMQHDTSNSRSAV